MHPLHKWTDGKLVRFLQCNPQDSDGWKEFLRRFWPRILDVCRRQGVSDPEDTAKEAITKAYERIHQLQEPDYVKTWLWRIAQNEILGEVRKQKGKPVVVSLEEQTDAHLAAGERTLEDTLPSSEPTPEQEALKSGFQAAYHQALEHLSSAQRNCFGLYYQGGWTAREIADFLEIKENTVRSHIRRARERLHTLLREYQDLF